MNTPDIIIVLSAGIKQDISGRWVSTGLTGEDDKQGAPGGILRVLAASQLAHDYPAAIVITTGALGYNIPENAPKDRPLLCEIMRAELLEHGVPAERVVCERNSNTTYQQLQELEKLIARNIATHVLVVTNRYHLPRLQAMLDAKFTRLSSRGTLAIVSAEEILIAKDRGVWSEKLEAEYQKPYLKERVKREQQGIVQIRDGTYNFR